MVWSFSAAFQEFDRGTLDGRLTIQCKWTSCGCLPYGNLGTVMWQWWLSISRWHLEYWRRCWTLFEGSCVKTSSSLSTIQNWTFPGTSSLWCWECCHFSHWKWQLLLFCALCKLLCFALFALTPSLVCVFQPAVCHMENRPRQAVEGLYRYIFCHEFALRTQGVHPYQVSDVVSFLAVTAALNRNDSGLFFVFFINHAQLLHLVQDALCVNKII